MRNPVERNRFDLGHYAITAGRIGNLQTLTKIPVIAGDSITLDMINQVRLSPMRRSLSVSAIVDYAAFYVPHRHIYGEDWTTMLEEGYDSAVSLGTVSVQDANYLGVTQAATEGASAAWLPGAYNHIYNWYYRYSKLTPEVPLNYGGTGYPSGHTSSNSPLDGGSNQRDYGFICARLKTPWTTAIPGTLTDSDHRFNLTDSNTTLDIIDLELAKMQYKSRVDREWFTVHYHDVLKKIYNSKVNTEIEPRPTMIMRKTVDLSFGS